MIDSFSGRCSTLIDCPNQFVICKPPLMGKLLENTMTIIAIGTPDVLKKVQQQKQREELSFKLQEDMRADEGDESLATWEHHAATMQEKIGYIKVWPSAIELFGKLCPKNMTALKQKVVAGAVAECLEKFADVHYFTGENVSRSMLRIGALHLLAKKVGRENFVSFSFAPILASHGITVPEWLELKREVPAPKHEERRQPVHHERPSRGALEMFKHAPAKANIAIRPDGTTYVVKAKHKPIVPLSDYDRAAREMQRIAAEKAKAAQAEAREAKERAVKDAKKASKNQKKN